MSEGTSRHRKNLLHSNLALVEQLGRLEAAVRQVLATAAPLTTLCMMISAFVVLMYIAIPFGSLFKLWGRDYSLSLRWYEQLIKADGFKAFQDSFVLSVIASPITALSAPSSWCLFGGLAR